MPVFRIGRPLPVQTLFNSVDSGAWGAKGLVLAAMEPL